jgi:FKBP-type peptidyl-prolyl cis-trans isomerase
MKITTFILFILITFNSYAQKTPVKAGSAQQPPVSLATSADSLQYILGAYLGQYIRGNGFSITNANLFIKGMNDALANTNLMVDAPTVSKTITEYQSRLAGERNVMLEKQLFESVKGKPGTGVLPSGVCYAIVKSGKGLRPQLTDTVQLHVKGYLPEGKLFEDTYSKKVPYRITPSGLIPGLGEVVQIMPAGSIWRVYIPSALAYGEKGVQGLIPPFSAVIFEVELLGITNK